MNKKIIYALGFFDGVHLGHQALIAACRELAQKAGAKAGVVTFDRHPEALILGRTPPLLNTDEDRERLLRRYGVEEIVTLPFDERLMQTPWQDFFFRLLKMDTVGLVCGEDFRFGHRGQGTAQMLKTACEAAGLPCAIVPEQDLEGVRISSTHIRALLEQGDVAAANRFLGHRHMLSGTVISGRRLGRTIGIPTANMALDEGILVPKCGVYACLAHTEQGDFPAVTNIGTRPTVGGHHVTVEPWLLDFEGDLYGKTLTLELAAFLRPEQKFADLEALKAEIQKNAAETRKIIEIS